MDPFGGQFNMEGLTKALQDPSMQQLTQQLASDPSFQAMQEQMQQAFSGLAGPSEADDKDKGGEAPAADFSSYMEKMQSMMSSPEFLSAAQQVGEQFMKDPSIQAMLQAQQDPEFKTKMEEKMKSLKADPSLAPVLEELETGGPAAFGKYFNNPEVLQKLGKAFQDTVSTTAPARDDAEGEEGEQGEEEEEGEEEVLELHNAASVGDAEALRKLLESGAAMDEQDDEGRTALHFAAGYGETECVKVLLEKGASLKCVDNNQNTPLHYAAGYGKHDIVKLLMDHSADCTAKNLDKKTPLEVAKLNQEEDVVKVLEATFV